MNCLFPVWWTLKRTAASQWFEISHKYASLAEVLEVVILIFAGTLTLLFALASSIWFCCMSDLYFQYQDNPFNVRSEDFHQSMNYPGRICVGGRSAATSYKMRPWRQRQGNSPASVRASFFLY